MLWAEVPRECFLKVAALQLDDQNQRGAEWKEADARGRELSLVSL